MECKKCKLILSKGIGIKIHPPSEIDKRHEKYPFAGKSLDPSGNGTQLDDFIIERSYGPGGYGRERVFHRAL
jgi:hypothetical protein